MPRSISRTAGSPGLPPGGGRSQRKHDAIARAALRLFLRDDYERTSVDAIAAEAGVSKRTVYSHYGDKKNLFLTVVRDTCAALEAEFADIRDRVLAGPDNIEQRLLAFIREVAFIVALPPDRTALLRLVITEAPHFPSLIDAWLAADPLSLGLTEPLTRIAAESGLDVPDPAEAARNFFALTVGQIYNRTLFGTITLGDAETDLILTSGVRAFLRAYGMAAAQRGTDKKAEEAQRCGSPLPVRPVS